MADQKRSDYLKSLNKMRDGYQNSGNPMINSEDDSTNVGEELSSFAYMNTEIPAPEQSSQTDSESNRNGWQKYTDTVNSAGEHVGKGVLNFLDDIFDFAVSSTSWLTGLVGGVFSAMSGNGFVEGWNNGSGWASDVIQYDWESQGMQLMHQLSWGGILSGDAFNGEQWSSVNSSEQSNEKMNERFDNAWQSDWGDFGEGVKNVEEGIGYMLPSLVVGVATGGASLGAQAAIQAGVSAASAYGRSVEGALDDGADYNQAMGYAAAEGAVEGAATFATTFIGGNVAAKAGGSAVTKLGSTVGKQVYEATGNATAKVVAAKTTELIAQAGISGAKAYAKAMAEPAFKTIYNDKTLQESYSGEELSKTLELARSNALMASATTMVVGVAKEGTKLMIEGKDAYEAEYLTQEVYRDMVKYSKQIQKRSIEYKSELDKISKRADSGEITSAEADRLRGEAMESLKEDTAKIQRKLESTAKSLQKAQELIKPKAEAETKKKDEINGRHLSEEEIESKNQEVMEALRKKWQGDAKKEIKSLKSRKYREYNEKNGITKERIAEGYSSKTKNLSDTLSRLRKAFRSDEIGQQAKAENIIEENGQISSPEYSTSQKIIESVFSENQPYDDISEQIIKTYFGEDGKYESMHKTLSDLNERVAFMRDFKFGMTMEGDIYSDFKYDPIKRLAYDPDGKMSSMTVETEGGDKSLKIKDGTVIAKSPSDLSDASKALSGTKLNADLKVSADAKNVNIPEVTSNSITTEGKKITFSANALSQIAKWKEISKALSEADYSNSYMSQTEDGKILSHQPLNDDSGKSVVMEIDPKKNEVTSIGLSENAGTGIKNITIIPKKDSEKSARTKAIDKKTKKPIEVETKPIASDSDSTTLSIAGVSQPKGKGAYVYSKKPLLASEFKKEITFKKAVSRLGISKSLSKTFDGRMRKGPAETLKWLSKITGLKKGKLLKKLGYDLFVDEESKTLTTTDKSNIIDKSSYDKTFLMNVDWEPTKKHGTIIYNRETDKFDVMVIDDYTGKQLPVKSFKYLKSAENHLIKLAGTTGKGGNLIISDFDDADRERYLGIKADGAKTQAQGAQAQAKTIIKRKNIKLLKANDNLSVGVSKDKMTAMFVLDGKESIVDMGKIKIGSNGKMVEDENTKVFFDVAKIYNEKAVKEFPATKKVFEEVSKKFNVSLYISDENGNKLDNPNMKSVSSLADRIKRNIEEKGDADPNHVKDLIRGTLKFDEKSKMTDIYLPMLEFFRDNGFDIVKIESKVGDFYKGIHTNLIIRGVTTEIQHHTDVSWASKIEGDKFYEEYHSIKNPDETLKGEELEIYLRKKKKAIEKALIPLNEKTFREFYDFIPKLASSESFIKLTSHKAPKGKDGSLKGTHLPLTNSSSGQKVEADILTTLPSGNLTGRRLDSGISDSSSENNSSIAINNQNARVERIIPDIEMQSAARLIEAGADLTKDYKTRLKSIGKGLETAIVAVLPQNVKVHIPKKAEKEIFAEVNLARPKDREKVFSNMLARIKNFKITVAQEDGDFDTNLGSILKKSADGELINIIDKSLQGEAVPTKRKDFKEMIELEKLNSKESTKTFKLLTTLNKKVRMKDYLSAPGRPVTEIAVYSKMIDGVDAPLTRGSIEKLISNIEAIHTSQAFEEMLNGNNGFHDQTINDVAQALKTMLTDEEGKSVRITGEHKKIANQLLDKLREEANNLEKGVKSYNYDLARESAVLAQAGFGDGGNGSDDGIIKKITGTVKSAYKAFQWAFISPIESIKDILGFDHPIVKTLENDLVEAYNNQRSKKDGFIDAIISPEAFGMDSGEFTSLMKKDTEFHGRKMPNHQIIKLYNTLTTAGDKKFEKRGISLTVNKKRVDMLDVKADEVRASYDSLPQALRDWNAKVMDFLNTDMREYLGESIKKNYGYELPMVENYYPTRAVGDKGPNPFTYGSGFSSTDWLGLIGFMKERVNTNAPFNMDGGVFDDLAYYIDKSTRVGEYSAVLKKLQTQFDTRVFGKGTSTFAIMSKNAEKVRETLALVYKGIIGEPYNTSKSFLGTIDAGIGAVMKNLQRVAVIDLFTQTKNGAALATAGVYYGMGDTFAGYSRYVAEKGPLANKKAIDSIKKYSPMLTDKLERKIPITLDLRKKIDAGWAKYGMAVSNWMNKEIVLINYWASVERAEKALGATASQEKIERWAIKDLEKMAIATQDGEMSSTISPVRGGYFGTTFQNMWGVFASASQKIFQRFVQLTTGWYKEVQRTKNYQKARDNFEKRELEYKAKKEEALKKSEDPKYTEEEQKEFRKKAEEYEFHEEGNRRSKESVDDILKGRKGKFTTKEWLKQSASYIAGLIGTGLSIALISKLRKKVYGQEEWDDWDGAEFAQETAYESFVNWIPIAGTIANSIKSNSDVTPFTVDNLNSFISSAQDMVEAFQEGNGTRATGKTLAFLMQASAFFGIPAQSIWKLANGVWYNIDKESNVKFKASLGFLSASQIKSNYSDALEKGQSSKAIANIDVWMSFYAADSGTEVASEIYRLNRLGISNVAPSAIPSSYTDDEGETVKLTSAQSDAFRKMYSKGGKQARQLVASSLYDSLDDEYKGKALKQLYSAYAQAAKSKSYGYAPTSKMGKLLAQTDGDLEMARYIAALQSLGGKSKEDAVKAVNKLSGFSRAEKLLVMWLNGYELTESNVRALVQWLITKGASSADANELLES